jgi:hypothetical protein
MWRPFVVAASKGPTAAVRLERDPNWEWRLEAEGEPLGSGPDRWFLAAELRFWLVKRAIEATDAILLHASVVSRDGRALMALAPSGGGKTTLSLALVERGWTPHGDDLVVIDPHSYEVTALPTPAGIRDPGRWPELGPRWQGVAPWEPSGPFLVPGAWSHERRPLPAGALAVVEYEPGARPALEAVSAAEGVTLCAAHSATRTPQAVATFAALCGRVPCVRLRYGSSAEAVTLVEKAWDLRR